MASKRATAKSRTTTGTLRIIGGQWRGRKLQFPTVTGLRPTGDRLRETLFNWLTPFVIDTHCLDLFAGSGALGLEALSRGAASATLVELSPTACNAIYQHATILGAGFKAEVLEADAQQWLQQAPPRAFDLVFLDPPFDSALLSKVIPLLAAPGWLSEGARIYIETAVKRPINLPEHWQILRTIETGQVRCQLLVSSNSPQSTRLLRNSSPPIPNDS
jgi:16S rRNA (guanine966-N2)-methyltransferase